MCLQIHRHTGTARLIRPSLEQEPSGPCGSAAAVVSGARESEVAGHRCTLNQSPGAQTSLKQLPKGRALR